MSHKLPLISVIIPSYNYANYLPDAINSVLNQKGDNFQSEIIVVDDGSKDNTKEVALGFGQAINYIYQENQGLSAARNTGINNASGDFLVFLDADDLLGPDVFARHLDNFNRDSGIDLSVCHAYIDNITTGDSFLWPLRGMHLDLHLCHSNVAPVHSFMTRAQTIREAGFFNRELQACEDYDYWLRCAELGKRFANCPEAFVIYRQHGGSMSSRMLPQFLHDVSVRLRLEGMLGEDSGFPRAGTYYGWLAYGSGLLSSSIGSGKMHPGLAQKMVASSARAILEGARVFPKKPAEDPHILLAERWFAVTFLISANWYGPDFPPDLQKALSFIKHRYPEFAQLGDDQLRNRRQSLNLRLLGEYKKVQEDLKKYLMRSGQEAEKGAQDGKNT